VSALVLVYAILFAPVALAVGIAAWAAASLLRDAWHCRHPAADVPVFHPPSVADEAQRWLQQH
jgi:hypothetical protein